MLRVAINGYGTIGKRIADAVTRQPDMTVTGVAKTSPDYAAIGADESGYPVYAVEEGQVEDFQAVGIDVAGTVEDLVERSDVVVDATPGGVGATNRPLYERHDTPALFQGGEDASVADVSFNARANFEDATDATFARVVSCNTTGLSRMLAPLEESYGIERVRATLVRRGGDPSQTDRGPINDIVPDPATLPSHHGPDVQTVLPDIEITTIGLKVPTTTMHVHAVNCTLESRARALEVRDLFAAEDRLLVVPEHAAVGGTGQLKDLAGDAGRPRGDLWENAVWEASVTCEGRDLYFIQAIHQESNVVPENVDAIRAVTGTATAPESVELTNRTLAIGLDRLEGRRGTSLESAGSLADERFADTD